MIVVDNDIISYVWLEAGRTEAARKARERDADPDAAGAFGAGR